MSEKCERARKHDMNTSKQEKNLHIHESCFNLTILPVNVWYSKKLIFVKIIAIILCFNSSAVNLIWKQSDKLTLLPLSDVVKAKEFQHRHSNQTRY